MKLKYLLPVLVGLLLCAAIAQQIDSNVVLKTDINTPSKPGAGHTATYSKAGTLCALDSSGNETCTGSGGGGGGSVVSVAIGSLPGTCTAGSLYLFTDTLYTQALCGSGNSYQYWTGFGLATLPPISGWTSENLCGGAAAANHGTWEITGVACAAVDVAATYRATPSRPFTIDVQIIPNDDSNQNLDAFAATGIGIRDSTGQYVTFAGGSSFNHDDVFASLIETWANVTTRSGYAEIAGPAANGIASEMRRPFFLRMLVDNTNITFSWSYNQGLTYHVLGVQNWAGGTLVDTASVAFVVRNDSSRPGDGDLISYLAH